MKKILSMLSVALLMISPVLSCNTVFAQTESLNHVNSTFDHNLVNEQTVPSNEELRKKSDQVQQKKDPKQSSKTTGVNSMQTNQIVPNLTEQKAITTNPRQETVILTFTTSEAQPFFGGKLKCSVEIEKGGQLTAEDLPQWANQESVSLLSGWRIGETEYSTETLQETRFSTAQTITADFKSKSKMADAFVNVDESIRYIFDEGATEGNVIVVPSPDENGKSFKDYTVGSLDGNAAFKRLLYDLYTKGSNINEGEFVIYVGHDFNLPEEVLKKEPVANPSSSDINFMNLEGRIKKLVITGSKIDEISTANSLPTGAKELGFVKSDVYFGTNMVFRNIQLVNRLGSDRHLYMNGHDLEFRGGFCGQSLNIYGGTDSGNVTGSPTIKVNATLTEKTNFYGGNSGGGKLIGNPKIILENVVGNIDGIYGGASTGTVEGSTSIEIKNVDGDIGFLYGGGLGHSATVPANVTGNVETIIHNSNAGTNMNLTQGIVGGVKFGTIEGNVTTTISGYGHFAGERYIGGSEHSKIGTVEKPVKITNHFDTSLFTSGNPYFTGGMLQDGVIYGNIENIVKTGSQNQGSLADFTGGSGSAEMAYGLLSETELRKGATESEYDNLTLTQRKQIAAEAEMRIHGNIVNKLQGGAIQTSYQYAAGGSRGGVVIGDITSEIGQPTADGKLNAEGLVYKTQKPTNLEYSSTNNDWTTGTGDWNFSGAGGTPNKAWSSYVYGNTKTIVNNAVLNSVYGGSYSGVIDGEVTATNARTSVVLNGGVLDTVQGGGFCNDRIFGHTSTIVINGQVNRFLTGGGWNDKKIYGNPSMTVHNGVINAAIGATYGNDVNHTVYGSANNQIFGGNFSGTPRTGSKVLSGGVANAGTLTGDANLTMDVRDYEGEFKLPTGTIIAAGNPYNQNNGLGTDATNTIKLNIFTKPEIDSLNGATIYGDGASDVAGTKSGKITMNIQATGSQVGNLYATNYSNTPSTGILRNVEVNIQGMKGVNGISGGNGSDDLTNAIFNNSGNNRIVFNFGVAVDGENKFQSEPIDVSGMGLVNFTELNITNGMTLIASEGNITNGGIKQATAHGTDYHLFGDIRLSNGAGLGILNKNAMISGAKLTIQGESMIESPPGDGKINLSDIEIPDDKTDRLTWVKNTTDDSNLLMKSEGTWFGPERMAYQVLTINPVVNHAEHITPFNFKGIEKETGATFIGDNDVTKASGYGIAIPGSVVDYQVDAPGIANGKGAISHNVKEVSQDNQPIPIKVWGTETDGAQVQKGRLIIPADTQLEEIPTLSFIPEMESTQSWLYYAHIKSTKNDGFSLDIPEQNHSDSVTWPISELTYSYSINVKFSNKAELTAKNIIVTESEAQDLTKEALLTWMEVNGRPFLTDSLSEADIEAIQQPLELEDISRRHPVIFNVGETEGNQKQATFYLVVVKDGSVISTDRSTALFAKDITLKLPTANALENKTALNTLTQASVIFAANLPNATPELADTVFENIKQTTADQLPKNVSVPYKYQADGVMLQKTVNVSIFAGELKIAEVPTAFDFDKQKITTKTETYWPKIMGELVIQDTRISSERNPWTLQAKLTTPLTNGKNDLSDNLFYVQDNHEYAIGSGSVNVRQDYVDEAENHTVTEYWGASKNEGLKLAVPVENQRVGEYEGTLSWSLISAPGNP